MIQLKPFDLQNVGLHYQWNNDAELNFYDSDYPHKNESFESFLKRVKIAADPDFKAGIILEIHTTDEARMIGVVDIHHIDEYNQRCELEITIGDRSFWNKGFGTATLEAAIQYCFETLGMHKIVTSAFDFNQPWINLVEKNGFVKEGVLRDHTLKNGQFRSKFIFGLLKTEYKASPAAATQSALKLVRN